MRTQVEITAHLKQLELERLQLIEVLELWAAVASQGIDVEKVESFITRPRVLGQMYRPFWKKNPDEGPGEFYDAVRLKDGSEVFLSPRIKKPSQDQR